MTLFRSLFFVGCMTMLAVSSRAQAASASGAFPAEKTVHAWLLSGNPQLVAWGAYYTLVRRDRNLIPDLLSLAGRWEAVSPEVSGASNSSESSQQADKRDAMAAVLDALIQMKASVPTDTLRNLAPDFGNYVAVLLSRTPSEEADSLSFEAYRTLADRSPGLQYLSAALLALRPIPGLAADLLSNINVRSTVFVVLPGAGGFAEGHCGGACFAVTDAPRKDWPMIGQYVLSEEKTEGALLLADGIDPIYARRTQSAYYRDERCGGPHLGSAERLRLIAEILGIAPDAIPWTTELQKNIEFQSLEQFDRTLLAFVDGEQAKHRATVAALADRGFLTSAEAQESFPKMELKLIDMRKQDTDAITDIPQLPPHVELSSSQF
jgi:hypothetical protein